MRIIVTVNVEVELRTPRTEDAARLDVERICLGALEAAGLEPVSLGATSKPA